MMSSTNGFCDLFRYNGTGRIRPQNATDSIICYSIKRRGLSINRVNFLSDFYLRERDYNHTSIVTQFLQKTNSL